MGSGPVGIGLGSGAGTSLGSGDGSSVASASAATSPSPSPGSSSSTPPIGTAWPLSIVSPAASRSASAVCAGIPQKRVPGIAAFGQRLPFERMAAQRPEKSSPASPPPKAASASAAANSASDWMSTFHPVRRAARRAFRPSLPIASASWSSGTMTVDSLVSSSM